jgi:hypothetical protein
MAVVKGSGPCPHGVIDAICWICTVEKYRDHLAAARARVAVLLDELEHAWTEAGGRDGASLYTPHPRGPADPEGCGACRGTGRKGTV